MLEHMTEIRKGHNTDAFNDVTSKNALTTVDLAPEKCFSVVLQQGKNKKIRNFVADSVEIRDLWADALTVLISTMEEVTRQKKYER